MMSRTKIIVILLIAVLTGIGSAQEVIKDPKTGRNIPTKKMPDGSVWFMKELSGGQGYTWEQAVGACPAGWHLPEKSEWETLNKLLKNEGGLIEEFRSSGASRYWWSASRLGRRFLADLCSAEGEKFACNETDISDRYSVRCVKDTQ